MRALPVLISILLLQACTPARFIAPLHDGEYAATVTLGGPLITYSDLTVPTPLTSLALGYGVNSELTAFAGLHLTALAFKDVQLDLGATQKLSQQDQWLPAISVTPVLNLATDLREGAFRLWPQVDLNAYWDYMGNGNLLYVNNSNWFDLTSTRSNGEPQSIHWIPSLGIGHILVGRLWQYTVEVKYLAPGRSNTPNVVDYHGISGHGDLALYFGITRLF